MKFHDPTGRCSVASAGAAALGLGVCILAAPEIVAGAVLITGVVVAAIAIREALEAYELDGVKPQEVGPVPQTKPAPGQPLAKRRPRLEQSPSSPDRPPLVTVELLERERRPECTPRRVPHRGGNTLHNTCADRVPLNSFSGWDVLVNGKNFDALQLATRTLWEVKTDDFDKHSPRSQRFFIDMKLPEIRRERRLAEECGYHFVVGVRSEAHKEALLRADPSLDVVVMDWC